MLSIAYARTVKQALIRPETSQAHGLHRDFPGSFLTRFHIGQVGFMYEASDN